MKDYYDVVICFGGFEQRVLGILNILKSQKIKQLVLMEYTPQSETVDELNHKNLLLLKKGLDKNADKTIIIQNNPDSPTKTISELRSKVFNKYNHKKIRVLIDISGCNNALIHNFVYFFYQEKLLKRCKFKLHFVYTKPKEYYVFDLKKENGIEMQIPHVRYVYPIPNFLGNPNPLKTDCLLLFIGYERFRSQALIQHYMPVKTVFLINEKPKSEIEKKAANTALKLHSDIFDDSTIKENTDFYSFAKIVRKLKKLVRKYSKEHNVVIGCFGSKIQTIATSIVSIKMKNITVANARPDNYSPRHYSFGIGKKYIIQITI